MNNMGMMAVQKVAISAWHSCCSASVSHCEQARTRQEIFRVLCKMLSARDPRNVELRPAAASSTAGAELEISNPAHIVLHDILFTCVGGSAWRPSTARPAMLQVADRC